MTKCFDATPYIAIQVLARIQAHYQASQKDLQVCEQPSARNNDNTFLGNKSIMAPEEWKNFPAYKTQVVLLKRQNSE